MSDDPVDLRVIAPPLKALTDEVRSMRDDLTVLTAITMRIDGTMSGMVPELRAMHSQHSRLQNRVKALESAGAQEDAP